MACRSLRGSADRNEVIAWRWSRNSRVAPFAGARIETPRARSNTPKRPSLPSRERGSKRCVSRNSHACDGSLPSRERGSKPRRDPDRSVSGVAPFAGARIETHGRSLRHLISSPSLPSRERGSKLEDVARARPWPWSLPSRERGSKPLLLVGRSADRRSLPSRERGSKLSDVAAAVRPAASLPSRERGSKPGAPARTLPARRRSLRGSADRNSHSSTWKCSQCGVAPFAGARIETPDPADRAR